MPLFIPNTVRSSGCELEGLPPLTAAWPLTPFVAIVDVVVVVVDDGDAVQQVIMSKSTEEQRLLFQFSREASRSMNSPSGQLSSMIR